MASYRSILRLSRIASTAKSQFRSTHKSISKFARPQSFSIPSSFSQIPHRVKQNLAHFKIHYSILLWISLLLSLAPHHKPTMFFLMAASKGALFYEVVLKAVPLPWKRILDRRFAMGLFLGAVLVELVLTGAVGRLGLALGVGVPVVLLHAVFKVGDDAVVGSDGEGKDGDADPIAEKKDDADLEK